MNNADALNRPERHPGDVIRVVIGVVLLVLAALSVRDGRVGLTEANVFQAINTLPDFMEDPFRVVLGATIAAALAAPFVALVLRRLRLARDLVLAAVLAWGAAEVIERIVERDAPAGLLRGVELRGIDASGLGFPSPYVAVAAGLATAASPFLTRRPRRLVWGAVALVAIARIFVGAHLPVDTVGGFAVGWIAGGLVHLAFGSPGGRPVLAAVRDTLARVDLPVADLAPAGVGRRGSVAFTGHAANGTAVFCRAIGRDERDADVLDKAWRAVALRDQRDQPFFTSIQALEHEAYVALLAQRAGVRTPTVWVTAGFPGGAVLVEEQAPGSPLAPDAARVIDRVLDDAWGNVATLRSAHLSHGALRAENVYVADGHAALVDWADGRSAATERQQAEDVAELLVSLAVRVGAERAVASAARGLGAGALVAVLPLLQPAVLSTTTRRELRAHKGLLDEVRAQAAGAAGVAEPKLEPLTRIRPQTLLVIAVLALGVHLLAPQVGELGRAFDAIRESNPAWLALALVASLLTYVAGGWSQTGAVRERLPLTRTTAMQLAAAFTSRLTPASLGTLAVRIRFLQRSGLSNEEAVTGTALNSVAGGIARLVAIGAAIPLIGSSGFGGVRRPQDWEILVAVVALGVVAGIVFFTAIGRRLLRPVRRAFGELATVLREPAKAFALLGGALAVIILNIICFAAALAAVHAHVGASTAIVVYLGGSTVGGAAPTPGGLGAVEAALVAGLTAAGVDASLAVAGVLTFRLLTYWLPIPLGYVALRGLRRQGLL